MSPFISIQGAREHNLKNVDLQIPRNQFSVITGLSGSGKSSLAFDTIYAEGQRRYVESLSPYARQFLEKMKKPDLDRISGLSPSISIEQKHITKNPRSTVGTITEIYDYLRLLYAKVGDVFCYQCQKPISSISVDAILEKIQGMEPGTRLNILAPIVRERKGEFKDVLEGVQKQGFSKVKIDGEIHDLQDPIKLLKSKRHNIDVVIDRIENDPQNLSQIQKSVEEALRLGEGVCEVEYYRESSSQKTTLSKKKVKKTQSLLFSQKLFCPTCHIGYGELTPNMFSFNSSLGACENCKGIGVVTKLLKNFVIADETKPILSAVNKEIHFSFNKYFISELVHGLKEKYQFDMRTPFQDLPEEVREAFYWGDAEHYGIFDELKELLHRTGSENIKKKLRKFLKEEICPVCQGGRLHPKSLGIQISGKSIVALSQLSLEELHLLFKRLKLSKQKSELAVEILDEIRIRLDALIRMGLGYLTLSRSAATLAGGEVQRVRLASQIGTGLTGVLYVLDEPSIGLHPRDNDKLLDLILDLKKLNNTVLVVEHDEATMQAADYLIDLGPGAGEAGGHLNFAVKTDRLKKVLTRNSLTLQYLRGERQIPVPKQRKKREKGHALVLKKVEQHNLKKINVEIPLGLFVCITGVSGSGKSTLIHDVLYKALHNHLWQTDYAVGKFQSIKGIEKLDKVIEIDQSPIGRTSRSNPATYIDLFVHIRRLFSHLPEAKIKGFSQGRFSFNVKGGRCEACEGAGLERLEMSFLPEVSVICDVCRGRRFNPETLSILYKGKSISDVLEMPVSEALSFFDAIPQIRTRLQVLEDVGLGYIRLGQSSTTLSGGEAQRIKIAYELCKKATGKTLYILDEPTTGLHFADIDHLLKALLKLRENGNSLIIIEHHLDVVKMADHIIDLGPEGGVGGGGIVATGTPEEVAKAKGSYTGRYLKKYLSKRHSE